MLSEKALIKNFKLSDLDNFLTCVLCDGYFRFAHTIAECGHTFCRECLKIHKPKNCPVCDIPLSSTVISKDPFKQNIVDLLYPTFQLEDHKVLRRMKELFGDGIDEIEINNLLAQKDYTYQSKRKKIKPQKQDNSGAVSIVDLVSYYLNISFEEFKKDIYDEKKFEGYQKIMIERRKLEQQALIKKQSELTDEQVQAQQAPLQNAPSQEESNDYIINLQPCTEADFKLANLNCVIKLLKKDDQNSSILKIRRFILRQMKSNEAKEKIKISSQDNNALIENVFNFSIDKYQIQLYYNDNLLKDSDSLKNLYSNLPPEKQITIRYEIVSKK